MTDPEITTLDDLTPEEQAFRDALHTPRYSVWARKTTLRWEAANVEWLQASDATGEVWGPTRARGQSRFRFKTTRA
jgi:hypothetical protein